MAYYVVGGEYADTTFQKLVKPAPVLGPFEDYFQAYEAWRARAMETVDQAYARFQIVRTVDAVQAEDLPGADRRARSTGSR
jgi:hypothetical protein